MLKIGETYAADICDTTIMGAGVAKIDGTAVFVKNTVTGDRCRITVTETKKSYAYGECVELLCTSAMREDSDCALFPRCGGCVFRHMSYEYENSVKESAVRSAFSKAKLPVKQMNGIVSAGTDSLRNKVTFHFDAEGEVGFYEHDSRKLTRLSGYVCRTCPEIFCRIAETVSASVKSGVGSPSELMLRISTDGEIVAAFTGQLTDADIGRLVMALCSAHPEVTGVAVRATSKDKYKTVMGSRHVTSRLMGLDFRISPEAFFQVNYAGAERLFGEVLKAAEGCSFSSCADLYCGTGTIGMMLASRFPEAHFTGVEINCEAVTDAKHNAKLNGLSNIDFYCGDAAGYASSESPELVVVDPPRRGLSDGMIDVLGQTGAEKVIYVSCNPFTLARDAVKLGALGYSVDEVTPVNLFPRSEHVETVCLLRRKGR